MAPLSKSGYHDDGIRLQALTMAEYGVPVAEITTITGVTKSTIYRLKKKARDRGYNPEISRALKLEYVTDNPHLGRPKQITAGKEALIVDALEKSDRYGREKAAWM